MTLMAIQHRTRHQILDFFPCGLSVVLRHILEQIYSLQLTDVNWKMFNQVSLKQSLDIEKKNSFFWKKRLKSFS